MQQLDVYRPFIDFLLSKYKFILITGFVFAGVAIPISLLTPDIYESSATLSAPRDIYKSSQRTSQIGTIAQTFGIGNASSSSIMEFAKNYFHSYKFLAKFIFDHDLVDEILAFKKYDPKLKQIVFKSDSKSYERKELFPDNTLNFSHPDMQEAVKEFRPFIKLFEGGDNDSSYYLIVRHQSPEFAYFLANNLIDAINKDIAENDVNLSIQKVKQMEKMFSVYDAVEVKKSLSYLIEEELTKQALASSVQGNSFFVLDPPLLPSKKHSPIRTLIVINSFIFGLIVALAYFSFLFSRKKVNESN